MKNRKTKKEKEGREQWSGGYGRRLPFRRSWVQIRASGTGWTIFYVGLV